MKSLAFLITSFVFGICLMIGYSAHAQSPKLIAHHIKSEEINSYLVSESNPMFAFSEDIIEAVPLNYKEICQKIVYPQLAANAGIQGTVHVRIFVKADGSYQKHLVVNTSNLLLSKAVEKQLTNLKFRPAIKDGATKASWVNLPFTFKLDN